MLKRFVFSLLALALTLSVYAAGPTATVSWTPPTAYIDNSALPASDIASYTVSWNGGSKTIAAPATTTTVPVPCGSQTFTVLVTTTSSAKYPATSSDPSAPITYASGVTCRPNPPGAVTAN